VAGKVGYALIPAGPGGKTYAGLWTWALGINNATKNKAAAWLFVQWPTAQRTLLNVTIWYRNHNPARASVTDNPRVQQVMGGVGRRQLREGGGDESRNGAGGMGTRVRAHADR
jgi:ABC-type glycerol-3-phosphate transport system substrate-binding protein